MNADAVGYHGAGDAARRKSQGRRRQREDANAFGHGVLLTRSCVPARHGAGVAPFRLADKERASPPPAAWEAITMRRSPRSLGDDFRCGEAPRASRTSQGTPAMRAASRIVSRYVAPRFSNTCPRLSWNSGSRCAHASSPDGVASGMTCIAVTRAPRKRASSMPAAAADSETSEPSVEKDVLYMAGPRLRRR